MGIGWSKRVCALVMLLGGCAQNAVGPTTARDDRFTPYKEYLSTAMQQSTWGNHLAYQLVGRRDRKTGALSTHAQVFISYQDDVHRKYDTARNTKAEMLRLSVITRESPRCMKRPCVYDEQFTVEIPEAELRVGAANGYAFKIFAKTGPENLVQVPKELIQSFFVRVDQPGAPAGTASPEARPRAAAKI